jgi:hypothetical protein
MAAARPVPGFSGFAAQIAAATIDTARCDSQPAGLAPRDPPIFVRRPVQTLRYCVPMPERSDFYASIASTETADRARRAPNFGMKSA